VADALSDLETAVSKELSAVAGGATSASADAQHAASQLSSAFAAQLRGSFFDGHKLQGPLADTFGHDPLQFAQNAIHANFARFVDLTNRVAVNRIEKNSLSIKDSTGHVHVVNLRPTKSSSTTEVVAAFVAECVARPASVADELQRMALGLGPGKGLDGYVQARHVFGVDDIAIVAAIGGLIITIGPFILNTVLSLLKGANPFAQKKQQQPADDGGLFGLPVLLLGGAGVVALVFFLRKKKGGAPATAPTG
jgi:hypothetical protein